MNSQGLHCPGARQLPLQPSVASQRKTGAARLGWRRAAACDRPSVSPNTQSSTTSTRLRRRRPPGWAGRRPERWPRARRHAGVQ
eukprot:10484954-Lingulodinium_polyedra.AAC.1